jgi:hypothetical protein
MSGAELARDGVELALGELSSEVLYLDMDNGDESELD